MANTNGGFGKIAISAAGKFKKIRQITLRKGSKESLFGPTLAFYRLKRRAFLIAFQLSTVFFGPAFFTSWNLSPFYVCNN